MNCGHPFFGHEKYCPECGQKNKGSRITFLSFISEVFNGFISLDAKFWTTLIPLLIKPGKVSRDFIEGKRQRYSNPFQFYISVSIVFFLILGAANKYQELQDFGGKDSSSFSIVNFENSVKKGSEEALKDLDSVLKNENLDNSIQNFNTDSIIDNVNITTGFKQLDSVQKEEFKKAINQVKDSLKPLNLKTLVSKNRNKGKFERMKDYQLAHEEYGIDQSLDSLKIEKTFLNRFQYTLAGKINAFINNTSEENKKLNKELVSYASISIFIFLPIFTLFLRFIYIRRKFTYVEHLIFVFHTQTVFFLLSTLFFILWLATHNTDIIPVFLISFLVYLLIAMKRFYQQGKFKTFVKFIMINWIFMIMGSIGFTIVALIAFAIY